MATVTCGHCGMTLRVPDHGAARKGRCPGCGSVFSLDEAVPELDVVELDEPVRPSRTGRRIPARGTRPVAAPRDGGDRPSRRERPSRRGARRGRYVRGAGSGEGTTVFILGLLGLVLCALLAPVAWIQGNGAIERCRRAGVRPDGLLVAGHVMGIIGTCLMGLSILLVVLVMLAS